MPDDGPQRRLADLDDADFERLYGPLARLRPHEAAALLDGFDAPWWIVGGWAIEAFTGIERPHDDVDIGILGRDVPRLVAHFIGTHHVWAAGSGMMRPILEITDELPTWSNQIWVRKDAREPWVLDIIVSPDEHGRWTFMRDPTYVADLEHVTWVAGDGIAYQNPEITLAFKAKHARQKDAADLDATLPKLDPPARHWLAETVARLHPGHGWLPLLTP